MHEYDAALKLLLRAPNGLVLKQVAGLSVTKWLNVEMQHVTVSRADLLGETADGGILHVELQSTNDRDMAIRMAEYALSIYRQYRRLPRQMVLYVGEAPVRMSTEFSGPSVDRPAFSYSYELIDFRKLDGAALLASGHLEDNMLAILTRLKDEREAIREILKRIASHDAPERKAGLAQFLIISGLRRLGSVIQEEAKKMPIMNDIMDHEVLGPAIRQGRQEGLREGRLEGLQEGRQEGRDRALQEAIREVLVKRFGDIQPAFESRLSGVSGTDLHQMFVRALNVSSLEDVF